MNQARLVRWVASVFEKQVECGASYLDGTHSGFHGFLQLPGGLGMSVVSFGRRLL